MVKFTIEEIRALMDFKHNIRNMSGACACMRAHQYALIADCCKLRHDAVD